MISFDLLQVAIFGTHLTNDEIKTYIHMAGLTWPIHQRRVNAHYPMDEANTTTLIDLSGNGNDGVINGAVFVPVSRSTFSSGRSA